MRLENAAKQQQDSHLRQPLKEGTRANLEWLRKNTAVKFIKGDVRNFGPSGMRLKGKNPT